MTLKARLGALTLGAVLATTAATAALSQGMGMGPAPMIDTMREARFAQIDTNGDKVLSSDEIRAYVAAQIKGLDANGDGLLTADEIGAKMTQLAHDRVLARATAFAQRLDKSGGGKVSVEDLAQMKTPMDRMADRMLKAGDGKITQATFETVMAMSRPMGGPQGDGAGGKAGAGRWGGKDGWRGHHERMGGMGYGTMGMMGGLFGPVKFSDIDTKGQGYITADDIEAYKLARVKAIDANGDGFITPAEFADHTMQKMAPRIQARADALEKRLDLNSDGKVSIEELAAAPMDMMFGHLPTDKDGNVTEQAFLHASGPDRGGRGGWHGGWHHGWRGQGPGGVMMPPSGAPAPDAPAGN